jgi:nucleoside-diphosphate-sugar epimerase
MRVLVTGHHGYIGSVLAPIVRDAGHDVVGLDTGFYRGCDFGASDDADIVSIAADVRDVRPAHLEGIDAVVHLAALSNDPLGDLDAQLTYDINLEGTIALARACREAGVRRFVFASSCSMYGASGTDELLGESAPLRPLTPYAESKARAEEALAGMAGPDFVPVSMRNATVYGASPRLRLDIVLNNLAAWAHTTGRIRLLSDGSSWRPLLHVRDLAKVAVALLVADEELVGNEAFNVGSAEQNYRVRELAELLGTVTGCGIELAGDASPDPRSYRVDFGKLERAFPDLRLDWDARSGATELVDAYRRNGLTRELFEGRLYTRLKQIRHLLDEALVTDDLRWVEPAAPGRNPVPRSHAA